MPCSTSLVSALGHRFLDNSRAVFEPHLGIRGSSTSRDPPSPPRKNLELTGRRDNPEVQASPKKASSSLLPSTSPSLFLVPLLVSGFSSPHHTSRNRLRRHPDPSAPAYPSSVPPRQPPTTRVVLTRTRRQRFLPAFDSAKNKAPCNRITASSAKFSKLSDLVPLLAGHQVETVLRYQADGGRLDLLGWTTTEVSGGKMSCQPIRPRMRGTTRHCMTSRNGGLLRAVMGIDSARRRSGPHHRRHQGE